MPLPQSKLDILKGYKAYIGSGVVALYGLHYASTGHLYQALPWFGLALGVLGIRRAIQNLHDTIFKEAGHK